MNKFYVGAAHIANAIGQGRNDPWSKPTLEAAIKHGKSIIEEEDKDCVIIVKVVAVLKREKTQIKVEKV